MRIKKLHYLCIGLLLTFASVNAQEYETLTVATGLNADVIANGPGPATGSISAPVDNANYSFMSNDFLPPGQTVPPAYALPVTGVINSLATTGLSFQLAPVSGNNVLRIGSTAGPASGSISFSNEVEATRLFVLATSGSGQSTISAVVTFDDATTQTVTGLIIPDWFNSTLQPIAAWGFGRVNTTNNGLENGGGNNPRLYQVAFNIDIANQTKEISSIAFNKTSTGEGVVNIFGVSAELVPSCPVISSATTATASTTSSVISWVLGTAGEGTAATTYTVEVYTDAAFTTPITGSPFTGITASSYTVTGLTFETQYYYRVKANNGACDSAYVTGSFSPAYCLPTKSGTSTLYYISNVVTTGGYTNIASATPTTATAAYNNYTTTQIVSKPAGTSFNFTITRGSGSTSVGVWVDWNNDLDFDDAGETIGTYVGGFSGQTATVTGLVTIPTGTPNGNYRMRIRSVYYFNNTVVPCGALPSGEAEDYTIAVVTQPADCVTPSAPTLALSDVTASGLVGTVTPAATAPSGYLLVRSTSATLTAQPVAGTTYVAGNDLGGGKVIAVGATLISFTEFLAPNTQYHYFVYAYNEGGVSCFGPIFSAPATATATTCAGAVTAVGASNITAASANLNYTSVVGTGGAAATYTVEVYTDAALTALFGTFTSTTPSYSVTGLTNGTTYYFRVKAETAGCDNDAWSAAVSFMAVNDYTPIDVTGFNSDVIANGNGIANLSTTNAVDAVDNAYLSLDYRATATSPAATNGLPLNRRLTGSVAGLTFLLQNYSANNSLRLPAQNSSGTLTFTSPVKASTLYFGVTSGSGTSTISARILFSDGTSQLVSGLSVINWDNAATGASPAVITNIGRVNRANTVGNPEAGNFKIFQLTATIDVPNQSKNITGVTFTKTSTGATEPVPHVFAISAKVIDECPVLDATTATATASGAVITYTLTALSGVPASYTIEIYTDAAFTTPVTGSPFTGVTAASYTATGLNPQTQYYYRVRALNNTCTSGYVTGSFTTLGSCVTPAVPVAVAQTYCVGATVANLTAIPTTGATLNWYADATGGTALASTVVLASGTYYVSQQVATCESERLAVTVTINTTAAPVATAQTFCTGATAEDLEATALTGATLTWYATEGGAVLADDAVLVSGTYYVTQTLNTCVSVATPVTVTVNTTAAPVATAQTFCAGATAAELEATALTGATLTWYATEGGAVLADDAVLVSGTYYVTQTLNTCVSVVTPVTVTVNTTAAPVATAQTFCAGATAAELEATALTGATLTWYATEGGAVLTDDAVLVSDTYYVTQTLNTCVSVATAVTVTVNTTAAPVATAQTLCAGATAAELEATALTGATLTWYATEGGAVLADDAVLVSGTYYVTQTLNTCVSVATPVTVTVNAVPNAPVATAQSFCEGATAAELEATALTGATLTWYATEGGAVLADDAVLASGTYYVSQTLNTCVSVATPVTVTVNTIPDAPTGAATQTFEEGQTVADIEIDALQEGAVATWYMLNLAGEYVVIDTDTVLLDGVPYYVSQTVNGCESELFEVTVTTTANTAAFTLKNLKVYPNPAADVINIANSNVITKVTVSNLLGQTVITQAANANEVQVNLTGLSAGTYLMQIEAEGATANIKIVKK